MAIQLIGELAFGSDADENMRAAVLERMHEIRPSVMYGDYLACDAFDATKKIARIKVPTLIMTGTDDQMTPMHQADFLQEKIKGSHIRRVDGAGHMLMLENPQVLVSSLQLLIHQINYQPGIALDI